MLITSSFTDFKKFLNKTAEFIQSTHIREIHSPYIFQALANSLGANDQNYVKKFNIFSDNYLVAKQFFSDISSDQLQAIAEDMKFLITAVLLEDRSFIDTFSKLIYDNSVGAKKLSEIKGETSNKFECLNIFIKQYKYFGGGFVFLSHFSADEDITHFYPFGKSFNHCDEQHNEMLPVAVEVTLGNFFDKKGIDGWIILLPMSPRMLLQDKKMRERQILQAVKLSEILEASIVGLGGLLGSVTNGGKSIVKYSKVNLTTGHAYTVANIVKMVDMLTEKLNIKYANAAVAIVGACGSVGSCCSELLSTKDFERIILIDTEAAIKSDLCYKLLGNIKANNVTCEVIIGSDISKINSADIVIVATNMPVAIIDDTVIKKGCIVIDDSYPKNVSSEAVKKRKDVIFLEGGATQFPEEVRILASQEMPNLEYAPSSRLFYNNQSYSCLSEVVTLCLDDYKGHYGLGRADIRLAKDMLIRSEKWGLKSALVECYGDDLSDSKLDSFRDSLGH